MAPAMVTACSNAADLMHTVLAAGTARAERFKATADVEFPAAGRALHVMQGEFAAVTSNAAAAAAAAANQQPLPPCIIGSGDATTCLVVCMRHPATGATALGHLDDMRHAAAHVAQLCESLPPAGLLQVFMVGGLFTGQQGCGHTLSSAILHALHSSPQRFLLELALVASLNVDKSHMIAHPNAALLPAKRGLAVCANTGVAWPAYFASHTRGPAFLHRSARLWCCQRDTHALYSFYDPVTAEVTVQPFPAPMTVARAQRLLSFDDATLLRRTSTSPAAESLPRFIEDVRAIFSAIATAGDTWQNIMWPEGRPLILSALACSDGMELEAAAI